MKKQKFVLSIFTFIFLVVSLSGCGGILKTKEGIPRKVVVSNRNGADLYKRINLVEKTESAKQWTVFFIVEKTEKYYKVSKSLNITQNKPIYLKSEDVFEWNLPFCIAFKNSPDKANRPIVKIFKTVEGLKSDNEKDVIMQEKNVHSEIFYPENVQPILKEVESNSKIYKIASLYDKRKKDGTYKFFGDYDFGYVKFEEKAHRHYRYVSKQQFRDNLTGVLGAKIRTNDPNPNPQSLDEVFNFIASLLNPDASTKDGVEGIEEIFSSEDSPSELEDGVFNEDSRSGQNWSEMNKSFNDMYEEMAEYLDQSSNWNTYGYAYIPVEWIKN